jgi:hypothetical protein
VTTAGHATTVVVRTDLAPETVGHSSNLDEPWAEL